MINPVKQNIEEIRKNPRKYFRENINKFYEIDQLQQEDLLYLLFSCIGYGNEAKKYYETALQSIQKYALWERHDHYAYYYYFILALGDRYNNNYDSAVSNYLESYNISIRLKDTELGARALLGLAISFKRKGSLDKAYTILKKILKMTTKIGESSLLGDIFAYYAATIKDMGDLKGADEAFQIALNHYDHVENKEEYLNYGIVVGNIAEYYILLNNDEKAEIYINMILKIIEDDDILLLMQGATELIADYYTKRKDYKRANEFLNLIVKVQSQMVTYLNLHYQSFDDSITNHLDVLDHLQNVNKQLEIENAILYERILNDSSDDKNSISLIKQLNDAVINDEFVPYFQSVWDVKTNEVVGYEALIRWRKNDGTVIPPSVFIELVEDSPLIMDMSESIIKKALKHLSEQISEGRINKGTKVSFNITPYQFTNQNLIGLLETLCLEHNVPKNQVNIEITERVFFDNNQVAVKQLQQLKAAGFVILLDDFGTGYSSLSCLASLPIDIVKIDMSLVKNVHVNEKDYQLLNGVLQIIKSLNLKSVAEGVETEEQLKALINLNCNLAQGYLRDRPKQFMV